MEGKYSAVFQIPHLLEMLRSATWKYKALVSNYN